MIGLQTGAEFIIPLLEGMEVQKLMREPATAGGIYLFSFQSSKEEVTDSEDTRAIMSA